MRCQECGCNTLLNISTIEPCTGRKRKARATTPLARLLNETISPKVDPTDKEAVSRAHAGIADRYRDILEPRMRPSRDLRAIRLREFERYLTHRYGRVLPDGRYHVLPDDDAGRHDLTILLNMLARIGGPEGVYFRMRAAAKVWTRDPDTHQCWIDGAELDELIDRILATAATLHRSKARRADTSHRGRARRARHHVLVAAYMGGGQGSRRPTQA